MLNVANRTLFTGDNLDVMRGINSACIDLIYLDPPFNSNADYAASIGFPGRRAPPSRTHGRWTMSISPGTGRSPRSIPASTPSSTRPANATASR